MRKKDFSESKKEGPLFVPGIEDEGVASFFSTKYSAFDRGVRYSDTRVTDELGISHAVVVNGEQVHEDHIEVIRERPSGPVTFPRTDGLVTDVSGVMLTTMHADCLPVYFFDRKKKVAALAHGGWRGTEKRISAAVITIMIREFGCDPADVKVHIGPGIGMCCFEVGPEVYEAFAGTHPYIDEFAAPAEGAVDVKEGPAHKYYIDLKGITARQVKDEGIPPANISVSPHCTCCEPELFISYRRGTEGTLRMTAGICLK